MYPNFISAERRYISLSKDFQLQLGCIFSVTPGGHWLLLQSDLNDAMYMIIVLFYSNNDIMPRHVRGVAMTTIENKKVTKKVRIREFLACPLLFQTCLVSLSSIVVYEFPRSSRWTTKDSQVFENPLFGAMSSQ